MTDNFSGLSNSPNYGDLVKHVNLKYVLSEKINNNLWRQTNHFKVHNYVSDFLSPAGISTIFYLFYLILIVS